MTVERGLRLMAGTFVLLSLALGYWVSPYWYLFTGVRRAEPLTIGLYRLVSRDVDAWQVWLEVERAGDARAGRTVIDCR